MSTLNLPFNRYTRQVSNGMARTKYSYQAMQQDLLTALQKAVWKQATCSNNSVTTVVNKVTQTDAVTNDDGKITKEPTYTTFLDDRFDAYKQGGDANTSTASFCGYAGMAAYRFKLPTNYSSNITQFDVMIQSSRYLRSGLRVCLVLSNDDNPSTDWSVIRGEGQNAIVSEHTPAAEGLDGVSSWGILNQQVPTLLESKPQELKLTFDSTHFPALGTSLRYSYLYVYISIEDYCDYWSMYSVTEPRYYSIEGSAIIVGSSCAISFQGSESSAGLTHTMDIVKGGVLPSVWYEGVTPESVATSQVNYVTVQRNGDPLNDGTLQMTLTEIEKNGGVINRVDVLPPIGQASSGGIHQFACICGKGFQGTFPNLDGLLIYDCENQRLIEKSTFELPMTQISINALNDETYHYGVVRCLMNYDQYTHSFYFLPCIGNHVPENRLTDGYYHYDILPDQVDGIYPSNNASEFYYFDYDSANNQLINVRVQQHGLYQLQGIDHNSHALIGIPGMAVDQTYKSSVAKTLLWLGVLRGDASSSGTMETTIKGLLIEQGSQVLDPPNYANSNRFVFKVYRTSGYTGYLKDLVTVPFKTFDPNNIYGRNYRAGVGVQVAGGKLQFNAQVYNDPYERDYESSITTDSSLKVIVLYKQSESTIYANGIYALNSSIEMAGITLNENAQVTHTCSYVKNNVITQPEHGNEFMITKIDSNPIKVFETFNKLVTGYPETSNWVHEFDNGNALWCTTDTVSSSVIRGSYVIYNDTYSLANSAEGLRICYGRFFNGEAKPLNGLTQRVGAGFSLVGSTQVAIQESQTTETLGCWQIVQSSLVVPFGCPRTWKAKQVRIDWNRWTGTATAGSKIYVWLCRGQFLVSDPTYLGKYPISTGGTVSGCELVGEINPTTTPKTATFNIQDLSTPTATIILTAFYDMDDLNPTANMTFPKGVGNISLNMSTMELNGTDTCFVPDIYLLG